MTNDRMRECLSILDWSGRGLAARLRINERTVRRWGSGDPRYPIPDHVAEWLETMAQFWEGTVRPFERDHPAPKVWENWGNEC